MKKYLAVWKQISYPYIEVEAKNEEEARKKAMEIYEDKGTDQYLDDVVETFDNIEEK